MSRVLKQSPELRDLDAGHMFDFIWENAVEGMMLIGSTGNILTANNSILNWLGYAPTELMNMTWMDVTEPSDTQADLAAVDQVIKGVRDGYTMNKEYRPKSGAPFAARLTVHKVTLESGEQAAVLFSQVQKLNIVEFKKTDELRVIWNFIGRYRKSTLLVILILMFSGEGLLTAVTKALEALKGMI